MNKTKEVEVGGLQFRIESLPGDPAFDLFYELLQPVAPAFAELISALDGGDLTAASVDFSKVGDVARKFLAAMPLATLKKVRDALFVKAYVIDQQGKLVPLTSKDVRDFVIGTIGVHHVFTLMWEALLLNYSDFFGVVLARVNAARASQSASPKQPQSVGPSTA